MPHEGMEWTKQLDVLHRKGPQKGPVLKSRGKALQSWLKTSRGKALESWAKAPKKPARGSTYTSRPAGNTLESIQELREYQH